jgi:hypothetical protein
LIVIRLVLIMESTESWVDLLRDAAATVPFRLIFPTSELGIRPNQRGTRQWRNTVFIRAAPMDSGKSTVVTLFVTVGGPRPDRSFGGELPLAWLELSAQRRAQLVAHAAREGTMPQTMATARAAALERVRAEGIEVPDTSYLYFFGSTTLTVIQSWGQQMRSMPGAP